MSRKLVLVRKTKYELLRKEIRSSENTQQTTPIIPDRNVQTTEEEEPDTDVFEKTLTYAIPKNGYRKAMGLWNYPKDCKEPVLNWKESGKIVVHDQSAPDSHLMDLLKHTVTAMSKREPKGYRSFYKALREMHTPFEFIAHHQSREGFFVRGKTDRGPPGTKTGKNNFRWIPY